MDREEALEETTYCGCRDMIYYELLGNTLRNRAMATVTISLPESLKKFVDEQLAEKGYGNVSEYFRGLLRDAQAKEQHARLEALLLEGLASGEPIPLDREFWTELRKDAARLAAEHANPKRSA